MFNTSWAGSGSAKPGKIVPPTFTYFEDFVASGGQTVVDLDLANESEPFGYFIAASATGGTLDANSGGTWRVDNDTVTALTQLPKILTGTGGQGGVCRVGTTDATSGERITMQHYGDCVVGTTTGGRFYMETKVKFTNTTQDAFIGLAVTAASDPHASRPAGFVAFTLTASATLEFATGNASTATASANTTGTIVAATWTVLAIEYNGVDTVNFYQDGKMVAQSSTTIPTGLALSPVLCIESNGAAETLDCDYVFISADRI